MSKPKYTRKQSEVVIDDSKPLEYVQDDDISPMVLKMLENTLVRRPMPQDGERDAESEALHEAKRELLRLRMSANEAFDGHDIASFRRIISCEQLNHLYAAVNAGCPTSVLPAQVERAVHDTIREVFSDQSILSLLIDRAINRVVCSMTGAPIN